MATRKAASSSAKTSKSKSTKKSAKTTAKKTSKKTTKKKTTKKKTTKKKTGKKTGKTTVKKAPRAREVAAGASAAMGLWPTHEEIAVRAFQVWQRNGRPDGHDYANWKQAEAELLAERGLA